MTANLFNALYEDGDYDYILAFNNGSKPETIHALADCVNQDDNLRIFNAVDQTIYHMWNRGWKMAVEETDGGPVNVAILNNDITIPPGFLSLMRKALRSAANVWAVYPDYNLKVKDGVNTNEFRLKPTQGTYQHGGMCGWAFMLRGEIVNYGMPYVDERFEWWYGDDDIVRNITSRGKKVCRVSGLPLDHINEATANNGDNNWTHGAKSRDTQRFKEKWS